MNPSTVPFISHGKHVVHRTYNRTPVLYVIYALRILLLLQIEVNKSHSASVLHRLKREPGVWGPEVGSSGRACTQSISWMLGRNVYQRSIWVVTLPGRAPPPSPSLHTSNVRRTVLKGKLQKQFFNRHQ